MIALLLSAACSEKARESGPTPSPSPSAPSASPSARPSPSATTKPSPVAKRVVYALGGDLWYWAAATDNRFRLTDTPEDEYDPKFIDTDRISYLVFDDPVATIYELSITTKARKVLFRSNSIGIIATHAWSPERSTIAYFTRAPDGDKHALRLYVAASRSTRVVRSFGAFEGREGTQDDSVRVEWQPDGRGLLLVATPLEASNGGTMFVLRATGANVIPPRRGTFARYARDGKRVFYREFGGRRRWLSVTVPGNSISTLAMPAGTYRPALSLDGTMIAFDNGTARPSVSVYSIASRTQRRAGAGVDPIWLGAGALAVQNTIPCRETADDPCFAPYTERDTVTLVSLSNGSRTAVKLRTTDADVSYG